MKRFQSIFLILFLVLIPLIVTTGAEDYYAIRVEYDASNNPIYVGKAVPEPNLSTSDTVWQITHYTYDASNNMVAQRWAEGSHEFRFRWSQRASYTYY